MGRIIPYMMENKKCSKPPTSMCLAAVNKAFGFIQIQLDFALRQHSVRRRHLSKLVWLSAREGLATQQQVCVQVKLVGGFNPSEQYDTQLGL